MNLDQGIEINLVEMREGESEKSRQFLVADSLFFFLVPEDLQ
jgi:hypothetical protein